MIALKEVHILNTLEEINIVSDPIRLKIIMTLGATPKTAQDLSDALGVSRSKIHYHLKILEQYGIIEVVDTELINGITQKYFLPVAKAFIPNSEIFNKNLEEKQFTFKIPKDSYKSFEKDLNELIKKYEKDDGNSESFQVQIYKLS
ncbi:TPA: helix-turn-helix transcriptional regulator [Clostridioides difficile]|uniref:ArsR/SmtB family transcription factor n=1 Tax=Clostridioides difficile TaxID=1496 RepID=UPI00097A7B37|nr:winged helix-turn-helix domain-containing protein [Clostridioides difficile]MDD6906722.1 winged helix-turn-helix domain-containing protein [Finegoldia magna]SHO34441.1 ArsR family transcriptional regulator 500715:501143 forward MW:16362 [Clostridioides difficile M120]EIS9387491.1 helix-turn-helix transcriptional regulator [Clostridioides difficile]EIS9449159.1 helix-turn-helix transcriptional regulator [Clostridioides difficile]EIS9558009.1 helix-turn-helix transcriptional regulator [Clostr